MTSASEEYYQPGEHPFYIRRSFLLEREPLPHRSANNKKFYTAVGHRRNRNGGRRHLGGDGNTSGPNTISAGTGFHPDVRDIFATLPRSSGFYHKPNGHVVRDNAAFEPDVQSRGESGLADDSPASSSSRGKTSHENIQATGLVRSRSLHSDRGLRRQSDTEDVASAGDQATASQSRGERGSTGETNSDSHSSTDSTGGQLPNPDAKPLNRLHRQNYPSFLSETVSREKFARQYGPFQEYRLPQLTRSSKDLFRRRDEEEEYAPNGRRLGSITTWEGKFSVLQDEPPFKWRNVSAGPAFNPHRPQPASENFYLGKKRYPDVREIFTNTWVDDSRRRTIAKKLSYFSNSDSSLESLSDPFENFGAATFPKASKPRSQEVSQSADHKSESSSSVSEDVFIPYPHSASLNRNNSQSPWIHADVTDNMTSIPFNVTSISQNDMPEVVDDDVSAHADSRLSTNIRNKESGDSERNYYYKPISITQSPGGSLQAGAFHPVVSFSYDDDGSAHVQINTPPRRRHRIFGSGEPNEIKFRRKRFSKKKLVSAILCGTFLFLLASILVMVYLLTLPAKVPADIPSTTTATTRPLPTVPPIVTTTALPNTTEIIIGFNGSVRIVNIQYTPELENKDTIQYKERSREFCSTVDDAYLSSDLQDSYQSCVVTKFGKGSVIVKFTVAFKPVPRGKIRLDGKNETVSLEDAVFSTLSSAFVNNSKDNYTYDAPSLSLQRMPVYAALPPSKSPTTTVAFTSTSKQAVTSTFRPSAISTETSSDSTIQSFTTLTPTKLPETTKPASTSPTTTHRAPTLMSTKLSPTVTQSTTNLPVSTARSTSEVTISEESDTTPSTVSQSPLSETDAPQSQSTTQLTTQSAITQSVTHPSITTVESAYTSVMTQDTLSTSDSVTLSSAPTRITGKYTTLSPTMFPSSEASTQSTGAADDSKPYSEKSTTSLSFVSRSTDAVTVTTSLSDVTSRGQTTSDGTTAQSYKTSSRADVSVSTLSSYVTPPLTTQSESDVTTASPETPYVSTRNDWQSTFPGVTTESSMRLTTRANTAGTTDSDKSKTTVVNRFSSADTFVSDTTNPVGISTAASYTTQTSDGTTVGTTETGIGTSDILTTDPGTLSTEAITTASLSSPQTPQSTQTTHASTRNKPVTTSAMEAPPTVQTTTGSTFVCREQHGFFPDPTNCVSFYACVDYMPINHTCYRGRMYSHAERTCVRYDPVVCGDVTTSLAQVSTSSTTTSSLVTSSTTLATTTLATTPSTTTTTTTTASSTTRTPTTRRPIRGPLDGGSNPFGSLNVEENPAPTMRQPYMCSSAGWVPAPGSCLRFISCKGAGQLGEFYDCPPGLMWNQEERGCFPFDQELCDQVLTSGWE